MTDLTEGPVPMDLSDPAELLSFIPYEFTFQPEDSLVVVSVTGEPEAYRLGYSARVGVDRLIRPGEGASLRRHMMATLTEQGMTAGFLIVYDDALFDLLSTPTTGPPAGEEHAVALAQHLITWFDYEQFQPERTFIVGEDAWRCLSCHVGGHCPPEGRGRSELKYTSVAASMVLRGQGYLRRREELIDLPEKLPPGTLDTRARAALRAVHRSDRRLTPDGGWLNNRTERWNRLLFGAHERFTPSDLAILALSLYSVRIRDNLIYAICTDVPLPDPACGDGHFTVMFESIETPDDVALTRARQRLQEVAAACPPSFREPILSVWAWCAWWAGNGAEAQILLDKALDTVPDYSLATTLQAVMRSRAVPPWRRNQDDQGRAV